ncbi:hypothetical protein Acr_17g0011850 [Actinidia rufa]|uniref:Uncharacterized protein n=1 Tax=Actinidia rufa TaxID=165716 RepID=A0A7J0G498_9ERIC|nr:hypothetical protein Acr_17g0011850 [Actinidia rufa]
MASPDFARAETPDELSLQSKLGGSLCWSSVRTPFGTGLARAEVPTSYRHGASLEILYAGARRKSPLQTNAPLDLSPSLPRGDLHGRVPSDNSHAQMETPSVHDKLPATPRRHGRVSHALTDTAGSSHALSSGIKENTVVLTEARHHKSIAREVKATYAAAEPLRVSTLQFLSPFRVTTTPRQAFNCIWKQPHAPLVQHGMVVRDINAIR